MFHHLSRDFVCYNEAIIPCLSEVSESNMVDEVFLNGNPDVIWKKYCGFLDLGINEFQDIQSQLLMEQLEMAFRTKLGRNFLRRKPRSVAEFRSTVPLTRYCDYAPFFGCRNGSVLDQEPYCWACTSGHGGDRKWVPFTGEYLDVTSRIVITAGILASADRRGEVNVRNGMRILHNLPPVPYGVGYYARNVPKFLEVNYMPDLTSTDQKSFEARTREGFREALGKGVDILSSLSSVLVKLGEQFEESNGRGKMDLSLFSNPRAAWRLVLAKARALREKRPLLPKDLWPLKGLISYGMDTGIYRDRLVHYWGAEPLQLYAATETGIMAVQSWKKRGMTFIPHSVFFEFIPEEEWLRSRRDPGYKPKTVLLNQVRPGERYELVITSFHGMPFLRYRLGDLVKIVSRDEHETGIRLPQMIFDGRADDIIDVASFARLDEKTIWQAVVNTGVKFEDWCVRKEFIDSQPVLGLYIELKEAVDAPELADRISTELRVLNPDYADLESMLGMKPLDLHIIERGSFRRYYEKRREQGADLAHLKPPHMNAGPHVIKELTQVM